MFASAAAASFGLLIGSFLNVVAYRLPRGESLVAPGSRCPGCDTPIRPYDNVPVLSWLLLRGRCRSCAAPIAPRYPLVEAATAALMAAVAVVHLGDPARLALGLALVAFLVPITLIDLEHKRIPNKLTLPMAAVGLALGTALDPSGQPDRLVAAAVAFGVLFLLALPGGMGMGDVKLVGCLGLFLGGGVLPAVVIAVVAGSVVGVGIIARKGIRGGRKTAVPFGPFLALGALAVTLAGDGLVGWYLDLLG